MRTIATIDIGTNSFHMIISEVSSDGRVKLVEKEKEIVRLGNSASDMKVIEESATKRAISTLGHFASLAENFNAEIIAVATSAVREANNSSEFLTKVKQETGIDIHLVSGMEEARLIYTGVINGLPLSGKRILVIDIGGGSTETIVAQAGESIFARSAKIGALRLTKKFFDKDNINEEDINEAREFISNKWSLILDRLKKETYEEVVVCSGTFNNLIQMSISNKNYKSSSGLNGQRFDKESILKTISKIIKKKNPDEISKLNGLDPTRKDIILAGVLIAENIINELKIKSITYSSYALREGILYNIINNKNSASQTIDNLQNLRNDTVLSLAQKFRVDISHAEHISYISEKLFHGLKSLHKLGKDSLEILKAASLLHDCGFFISQDAHHKHSYYLIANAEMPGFAKDESDLIAQIARYHRKSMPKKTHSSFDLLSKEKQYQVWILGGILRIAEGIDRKQKSNVVDIDIFVEKSKIHFKLISKDKNNLLSTEIWSANSRKDMLSKVLNKKIEIS